MQISIYSKLLKILYIRSNTKAAIQNSASTTSDFLRSSVPMLYRAISLVNIVLYIIIPILTTQAISTAIDE